MLGKSSFFKTRAVDLFALLHQKMQAIIKLSNAYTDHIFPKVQVATNKNVINFRNHLSVVFCQSVRYAKFYPLSIGLCSL